MNLLGGFDPTESILDFVRWNLLGLFDPTEWFLDIVWWNLLGHFDPTEWFLNFVNRNLLVHFDPTERFLDPRGFWILEVNSRVLIQIYCILTMEEYGQNGLFDPSEVYLENVIRRMPEFGCCFAWYPSF